MFNFKASHFFFKLNALGYLLKRENRMYLEIELKKIVMKTVLRLKTFLGHYKLCREILCQMKGQYYAHVEWSWRI